MHGTKFWQLGLMVQDIEAAMTELSTVLGLEWSEIREAEMGGTPLRVAMSRQGPPYFELVQGPPGSHWDCSDGSRLDHLGYWTDGYAQERARLESVGAPVDIDAEAISGRRLNYHRLPQSGFRIEMFDADDRQGFRERWGFEDVG